MSALSSNAIVVNPTTPMPHFDPIAPGSTVSVAAIAPALFTAAVALSEDSPQSVEYHPDIRSRVTRVYSSESKEKDSESEISDEMEIRMRQLCHNNSEDSDDGIDQKAKASSYWGLEYLRSYNGEKSPCPEKILKELTSIKERLADRGQQYLMRASPIVDGCKEGLPDAWPQLFDLCSCAPGWAVGLIKCALSVSIGSLGFESSGNQASNMITSTHRFQRVCYQLREEYLQLGKKLIDSFVTCTPHQTADELASKVVEGGTRERLRHQALSIKAIAVGIQDNMPSIVSDLTTLFVVDEQFGKNEALFVISHLFAAVKIVNKESTPPQESPRIKLILRIPPASLLASNPSIPKPKELFEIDPSAEAEMKAYEKLQRKTQKFDMSALLEKQERMRKEGLLMKQISELTAEFTKIRGGSSTVAPVAGDRIEQRPFLIPGASSATTSPVAAFADNANQTNSPTSLRLGNQAIPQGATLSTAASSATEQSAARDPSSLSVIVRIS